MANPIKQAAAAAESTAFKTAALAENENTAKVPMLLISGTSFLYAALLYVFANSRREV